MPKRKSGEKAQETGTGTSTLGGRVSVGVSDGLSFSQGGGRGGPELVPQAHGGALLPGGTPEGRLKGKQVIAERRRARAERSEAVDDAIVGHVEKMSAIIAQLVQEAGGEQYRCTCGVLGPKVPKLKLKEATEVAAILMRSVKQPDATTTIVPIQVIVQSGGPLVPGQIPTSGPNP